MTRSTFRAAAVAALLASASFAAPAIAADPPAPKISSGVSKPLVDAQKAINAKDFPTALEALKKAQAVSSRQPYDDYVINFFLYQVDMNMPQKDEAGATVALEAAADSPAIPDNVKHDIYFNAMILANNAKHYDKAIANAKRFMALTPPPSAKEVATVIQIYGISGDNASAIALAKKPIDAAVAAGKRPALEDINTLFTAQAVAKDEAGARDTLQMRAVYYNAPEDWAKLVDSALGTQGESDQDLIYLGRLLFATGATVSAQDATIIGQTASHLALYGDAQTAQKHGGTGFSDPAPRADADKKTIAAQIAAEAKSNGQYNVKLAQALYGYGMYAEAETAARLAQTKGGMTDASEAPMVIGMSQVAQGKFADAATTFGTVTGGSPITPRIARMWADFAKGKANPPAAQ